MMARVMDRLVSLGDALLGRGEHAVTVPPMDGALQPNQALEAARSAQAVAAPDNLVRWTGHLCHSSGDALYRVEAGGGVGVRLKSFGVEITCLAALDSATLVVGLDDGRLLLEGGPSTGREIGQLGDYRAACPTAVLALDEHLLVVAEGSARQRCSAWRRDLMAGEKSGAVWLLDLRQASARCLARGLAFPNGLARTADGGVAVSESWRHRLLKLPLDGGSSTVLLADLPGYPGRLSPAADGGHWLCLFAPRSQLVEFVLREPKFLHRMMAEVPEGFWVAPALSSGRDFREPLQGGSIKSMGILKPWAPTRSYGLVVRLDAGFAPVSSLHSRADGRRHGITSAMEWRGELWLASRGGDELVAAPLA